MESTLFYIGCGLGLYGVFLRRFYQKGSWLKTETLSILLHLIFVGTVGGLIGFVFSASTDLHGPSPRWPLTGAVIGLLWGIAQIVWNRTHAETTGELIKADQEWVETSFSAILLASVIMYAVLQAFKIPSGSMENTLLIGDHLFVNKFIYGIRIPFTEKRILKWHDVQHGEIVVFEAPRDAILSREERERGVRKDFIKRAVGMPGDIIEIRNKQLFINGKPENNPLAVFKDPNLYAAARLGLPAAEYQHMWETGGFAQYPRMQIGDNFGPVKVPEGNYFVMGDNRDGSFDSRFWGPLPLRYLKGRAWIVYWPFSRMKVIR